MPCPAAFLAIQPNSHSFSFCSPEALKNCGSNVYVSGKVLAKTIQ